MDVTVPSTMVEDLLESDGGLRHDRLVAAVAQGDVGLETVTDEVLLLCGRDAMAGPQDHWTPWLLRQPDDHVEVARTTTLRYLLSAAWSPWTTIAFGSNSPWPACRGHWTRRWAC
jgi:hypothetical protein